LAKLNGKVLGLIGLSFTLLLFSINATAIERFTVAFMDNPPWSYIDRHGKIDGIYPKLLRHVARQSKGAIHFSFRLMPLARVIYDIDKPNGIDFTFMTYKRERSTKMLPVISLFLTPFVIVSTKSAPISTLQQLKDKRVTSLIGGTSCPCIGSESFYQRIKLERHVQALKMLKLGRVDAVSGPGFRLNKVAKSLGITSILARISL